MIQITAATASGTTPALYGVEIEENICQGYPTGTTPTAVLSVAASGAPVVAGGVTFQNVAFAVTLTYQPCGLSSETRVKTYTEVVSVALPGSLSTITPNVGTVTIQQAKVCNGRARAVRILSSLSVAYR